MKKIIVNNFGPIKKAAIELGELTVFVGTQATGKSILLQLLKLVLDKKSIRNVFKQYGFNWSNTPNANLDLYFGEGLHSLWNTRTDLQIDDKQYTKDFFKPKQREKIENIPEKMFYIPAQRVLSLANGWPRPFSDFDQSVPFVLRQFSETIRRLMERPLSEKGETENIFPVSRRLNEGIRNSIENSVFKGGRVYINNTGGRKNFRLGMKGVELPFMTWSAGQKEFMPLLLSLYWLCPSAKISTRSGVEIVVIEEPEMGLHPLAMQSVLLQVLDLMQRGYKVILSTHSQTILEFIWAIQFLKRMNAKPGALSEIFNIQGTGLNKLFNNILKSADIYTYYFKRNSNGSGIRVEDISALDINFSGESDDGWGGLSEFSGRVNEVVSKYANNN